MNTKPISKAEAFLFYEKSDFLRLGEFLLDWAKTLYGKDAKKEFKAMVGKKNTDLTDAIEDFQEMNSTKITPMLVDDATDFVLKKLK